jgi:hypothetical protein
MRTRVTSKAWFGPKKHYGFSVRAVVMANLSQCC